MKTLAETLVGVSALVFFGASAADRALAVAVLDYVADELAGATPHEQRAWCAACRRRARVRLAAGSSLQAEREFYRRLPAFLTLRSPRPLPALRRPRRASAAKTSP